MRPRQFSRGNLGAALDRADARLDSFNEAAAIQPRKPATTTACGTTPCCFNEAAAIQPRKLHLTVEPAEWWQQLQ